MVVLKLMHFGMTNFLFDERLNKQSRLIYLEEAEIS